MIYKRIRNIFSLIFSVSLIAALTWSNSQETFALGTHLDATFAGNGKLATDFNSLDDQANDLAIQADGKIVVVGSSGGNFALTRYNTNGTLDITFSGDGRVTTIIGNDGSGVATSVLIQPDGKIVVAGYATVQGNVQIVVARYHSTGTLDSTFNGGIVYASFTDFYRAKAFAVSIQPGGQIVAVGQVTKLVDLQPHYDWAVVRFTSNGLLDNSFDGDGKLVTSFNPSPNSSLEEASAVVILPDGKILAGGTSSVGADLNFALVRYNTNGTLDTLFDGDGKVSTDFSGNEVMHDVKIQPDGKIVAAGSTSAAFGGSGFALARYLTNGSLDTTFNSTGKLVVGGQGLTRAAEVAIQADGKIVAAGGINDFTLIRFNPNGSYDGSFGGGGFLVTEMTSQSVDTLNTLAIQQDGKLVVAGSTRSSAAGSTNNFGVMRFLPNIGQPFDFDGDGKADLGIFRPASGEWWINRSSTGATFAAQFGQSSDKIAPADFTGDGKTDIAFFRPSTGFWFVLRSEDSSFYSFPFGADGDIPAPADFDGDDKADAAVFRPSNGTWYISRSAGGTTILQFGQNGDIPVPASYDWDLKADIAIFRPSSGQWWIERTAAGTVAYQFGTGTDKPVPGDYTGDGFTDVAFWRPSTGSWFVLRSQLLTFYSFPFGSTGDIPAPGDFDGDGRLDATVFRPSNATWYSQRSTAGTLIQQFGASTDRPVPSAFVP